MTGRPVNIADFRCRVMKARTAQFLLREASRSNGLRIVEPANESSEKAPVFDIGLARQGQRMHRRPRPISIQRRAQVIRFGEIQGRAMAAAMSPSSWRMTDDLPPAA